MTIKTYRLYFYDVWGNSRDGWNVNDIFPASWGCHNKYTDLFNTFNVMIPIDDDTPDSVINRRLKLKGITWESDYSENNSVLYGTVKRNGKPFGELRLIS